ncbi:NEDD4 family-interacting protein 1-like [Tachypleus tridentatus]|uniref:NEDD4 family-interacting protein 1-like n=1 Tax=Tachypleus tridentatus TaxID=6853 RepID=UPI003FD274DC
MEREQTSVAYQMLKQQEDGDSSPVPTASLVVPQQGIPPPAYDELVAEGAIGGHSEEASCNTNEDGTINQLNSPKSENTVPVPPPYDATDAELPTYEEVQRSKILERGEDQRQDGDVNSLWSHGEEILGTDFLFFTSFFVAFLFNWVGFLLLVCFCHTLAGRYGALAGLGLSLAKWTLIVKHSTDFVSSENEWLWWIIMAFGILICARSCLQYVQVKREWRLLNPLRRERLYFFY